MSRTSGTPLWPWLLVVAVIAAGVTALVVTWPSSHEPGVVVLVRVVTPDGRHADAAVRATGSPSEVRVDSKGEARIRVVIPASGPTPAEWLTAAVVVESRFHAEREREVRQDEDGSWEIVVTAVHHGVIALRIEATVLPQPRAYLETNEFVQPVGGMGVARLGQAATYRVFPGADTILLTALGDTGTAMERFRLRAPSPGFVLQHDVRVRASRPLSGRVIAPEDVDVPTLTGLLHLLPSRAGSASEAPLAAGVDPYVEIDPVQIRPDGTFLAPHAANRAYTVWAELDFLGTTEPRAAHGGEDIDVVSDVNRAWVNVAFADPIGIDPHDAVYAAESLDADLDANRVAPRVLHHEARTYFVIPTPGRWAFDVRVPGTQGRAPLAGRTEAVLDDLGPHRVEIGLAPAPHGRVVVDVPDAVRTAMRGGTLIVDVEGSMRTHSLLRNLTKQVVLENVEAGQATVRIEWQDAGMAAWETHLEVLEGGEVRATAERRSD